MKSPPATSSCKGRICKAEAQLTVLLKFGEISAIAPLILLVAL